MTLVEVLHPLKRGRRKVQVLAVLYFYKTVEGRDALSTGEIRAALQAGGIPQARTMNVSDALRKASPHAHRVGPRQIWALTPSGEDWIRDQLAVPDDRPQVRHDVADLESLVQRITNQNTRSYIEEGVKCLKVDALRAAVVFIWTGAISVIRDDVWTFGPPSIDAVIKQHDPKARAFHKKSDFENVKDSNLLQLAHTLGVYDKSEKKRLKEALDLRNDCGHPVKYRPGTHKVAGFIEDVVGIVF